MLAFGLALLFLVGYVFFIINKPDKERKDKQQMLVGEWKAKWETTAESFPEVDGIKDFTMQGKLIFGDNGRVSIAAFGFPGCIFSADTMQHELNWRITNDTLKLVNDDDPYGMPYNIQKVTDTMVELKLMDDIFLTLSR